jgi:hypothetical protein
LPKTSRSLPGKNLIIAGSNIRDQIESRAYVRHSVRGDQKGACNSLLPEQCRQIDVKPYGDGHSAQRIVDLILRQDWQSKTSDYKGSDRALQKTVFPCKTHRAAKLGKLRNINFIGNINLSKALYKMSS